MSDLRERRRQLLNLTITEIILMLLFLILLITATLISKNNQLIKESKKFKNLNESDVLQMAAVKEAIKKAIGEGEYAKMTPADITETVTIAITEAEENKGAGQKNLTLTKQLIEAESEVKRLNEKYGSGIPPCWIKEGTVKKIEYLYYAVINDSGIILTSSTYSHRLKERKTLPLDKILEGTPLSPDQFRTQTNEVFKLKEDTCRHYVSVKDRASNNKLHWKKHKDAIEDRFYIYEDK